MYMRASFLIYSSVYIVSDHNQVVPGLRGGKVALLLLLATTQVGRTSNYAILLNP
jgi:hypothetical protein